MTHWPSWFLSVLDVLGFAVLVAIVAGSVLGSLNWIVTKLAEREARLERERRERFARLRLRNCTPSPDFEPWILRPFARQTTKCKGSETEST